MEEEKKYMENNENIKKYYPNIDEQIKQTQYFLNKNFESVNKKMAEIENAQKEYDTAMSEVDVLTYEPLYETVIGMSIEVSNNAANTRFIINNLKARKKELNNDILYHEQEIKNIATEKEEYKKEIEYYEKQIALQDENINLINKKIETYSNKKVDNEDLKSIQKYKIRDLNTHLQASLNINESNKNLLNENKLKLKELNNRYEDLTKGDKPEFLKYQAALVARMQIDDIIGEYNEKIKETNKSFLKIAKDSNERNNIIEENPEVVQLPEIDKEKPKSEGISIDESEPQKEEPKPEGISIDESEPQKEEPKPEGISIDESEPQKEEPEKEPEVIEEPGGPEHGPVEPGGIQNPPMVVGPAETCKVVKDGSKLRFGKILSFAAGAGVGFVINPVGAIAVSLGTTAANLILKHKENKMREMPPEYIEITDVKFADNKKQWLKDRVNKVRNYFRNPDNIKKLREDIKAFGVGVQVGNLAKNIYNFASEKLNIGGNGTPDTPINNPTEPTVNPDTAYRSGNIGDSTGGYQFKFGSSSSDNAANGIFVSLDKAAMTNPNDRIACIVDAVNNVRYESGNFGEIVDLITQNGGIPTFGVSNGTTGLSYQTLEQVNEMFASKGLANVVEAAGRTLG